MKKEYHASSNRKKRIIVILLVVLLLIIAFAYGFMLGIKYANKNCAAEQDKNEIVDDDNDVENDMPETTITKEDIENFLSPLVSGYPNYNFFVATDNNSDYEIFMKAIKYLIANKKYTLSDDNYIFNQSDIKEFANMYLMKENFDYIPNQENFIYDSASKTVTSSFHYDLFGFRTVVTKEVDNYAVNGNEIIVIYKVSTAHINFNTGNTDPAIDTFYTITLEKIDNGLKIINIVNN